MMKNEKKIKVRMQSAAHEKMEIFSTPGRGTFLE